MVGNGWYTYGKDGLSTTGTILTWYSDSQACTAATTDYPRISPPSKWNMQVDWGVREFSEIPSKIPAGQRTLELPDGAQLVIDDLGNYRIVDQHAQVKYQANRVREFSPHLNSSDLLAEFVKYAGSIGVRRADVMQLPIELFLAWLIIEAAERDGDEIPPDVQRIEHDPKVRLAIKPKCLACGRFIKRLHYQHRFPFCSPEHGTKFLTTHSIGT